MSKQEIAALSVRILALYIVVNAIVQAGLQAMPYIQQVWYASAQGINNPLDPGSIQMLLVNELVELLFPLAVAFILWKFANKLSIRMVKDSKPHVSKQSVTAIELQTIIVSVIGLFVTISSIPQLVLFFVAVSTPSIPSANFTAVLLQLVNPLLSLLMGWFLLWNAARISHFLQRELQS